MTSDALSAADAAALILEAIEGKCRVVVALRPDAGGSSEGRRRVSVEAPGGVRRTGSVDGGELDRRADRLALELLAGTIQEGMHDGLYLELHGPRPELVIVGAGHIAQPLSSMGALLGFRVTVVDDRPSFATRERFPDASSVVTVDFAEPFADVALHALSHVVLVTRGHRYDYECLRRLLHLHPGPGYVGMIGSRRRVRATFEALVREAIPRERLATVHAPVGLDLGARTPAEIAVSVAAELVQHGRGGSGRPLRDVERVLERFLGRDASAAAPGSPGS
jgi:xanthine dehydrogenase accessory factor